ncbi:YgjV family protein [Salinisphaera sp. Q1T1-3]|uniref:YgjV family protein n=1 Tax=Salinisphaera sp. Q1T1-3 TaxID=2321229 RepID=UPI000E772E0F|nr:YgjV family protein [Salinisphaera sp. Q1T1-3]RJS93628.1 YgjV family protein [Salinisphaera sp. Q1T1-3]
MLDYPSIRWWAGQGFGLIALALCVAGFANKRDDRLFVLLLFANVAFALQFALFRSWAAAAIAALIVLRVHLVRRYKQHWSVMLAMAGATLVAALITWSAPRDAWALAAGLIGTYGMFMHDGPTMRWMLAAAAFCWVISNLLIGSLGGTLAESLILITNLVTIARLHRSSRAEREC